MLKKRSVKKITTGQFPGECFKCIILGVQEELLQQFSQQPRIAVNLYKSLKFDLQVSNYENVLSVRFIEKHTVY